MLLYWESITNQSTRMDKGTKHTERALNKKELAWKKDALDLGKGLVEKYSASSMIFPYTPSCLEKAFETMMLLPWWKRPRKFLVATGMGYLLGQYLVEHLDFEWLVYQDFQGKDIAVKHKYSDIIAFPISSIRKRLQTKEYRFIKNYIETLSMEVKQTKKRQIPQLHYVSQQQEHLSHLEAIERACKAGCQWVQLRMKDTSFQDYLETAIAAKKICQDHQALLTINDNVQVALESGADGLHLGKEDMKPSEARNIVGDILIGGTANTWEDVQRLAQEPIDYIGLGPFRYTATKKKLSPILGVEGYQTILEQMEAAGIEIPVLAIGGIVLEDLPLIMETGVWGLAVSSLMTNAEIPLELCTKLKQDLALWQKR